MKLAARGALVLLSMWTCNAGVALAQPASSPGPTVVPEPGAAGSSSAAPATTTATPTAPARPAAPGSTASESPAAASAPPAPDVSTPAVPAAPTGVTTDGTTAGQGTANQVAGAWADPAPTTNSRPRLSFGAGMGASLDDTGLLRGRTGVIPVFHGWFGIGDGLIGVETRLLTTEAAGRFFERDTEGSTGLADQPVDRLNVEALLVLRPFQLRVSASERDDIHRRAHYGARLLHSLAVAAGPAVERLAAGQTSRMRWLAVVAVHADIPLTGPTDTSELRLRVAARHAFGPTRNLGGIRAGDSLVELLAGLAVSF